MNELLQTFLAGTLCFIFISLLFSFILFIVKKCNPKRHSHSPLPTTRASLPRAASFSTSFDPCLPPVTISELSAATHGFDPNLIIGDGGFGLVYKANLPAGATVAVKKLSPDAFQGLREFRAEMETLGKLAHPNIVKILGYCVSGSDRILIYEFFEKGSLDQWVHDTSSSDWVPLSWGLRVKIIKGVANGLAYLHGLDNRIVHRDIKASNVLLDNEFEAHIADFGLARRIEGADSHFSTQAAGTMGYMPPEYIEGCTAASMKGDVYSFGVLMFEVATGKRPNWPMRENKGPEIRMVEWAKKKIEEEEYVMVVDASICRSELNKNEVYEYFRIANLCTSHQPKERPSMCDIVNMLDCIGKNFQEL